MRLVDGPIDPALMTELAAKSSGDTEAGAISFFVGKVRRDIVDNKYVKGIEYSAYDEMVIAEAGKISRSVLSEFNDVRSVEILHSKGMVEAGQISLIVAVSAGHRHQASEACAKTVELIKEKLPIWKKEVFENDSSRWKGTE